MGNFTLTNAQSLAMGSLSSAGTMSVAGDSVTGVSGLAFGCNAGRYDDALSGATGSGLSNYAIRYVNGGLTVDRAALTVTAANAFKHFDGSPW